MQAFRIKSSSTLELNNPHFRLSHNQSTPNFPFRNRKLQAQSKEKDMIQIKAYKSRAQVSRKRLDSIPLLKNIKLDQDKISIFKSAKDEYNLFMRKSKKEENYNQKIMVVNG